jgi:hypothetical protein
VRSCALLVGGAIAALLVLDLALVFAAQRGTLPPPAKQLSPDQLAMYRRHVGIVAVGAAVIAPWIAALLAAVHARAARAPEPRPRP